MATLKKEPTEKQRQERAAKKLRAAASAAKAAAAILDGRAWGPHALQIEADATNVANRLDAYAKGGW